MTTITHDSGAITPFFHHSSCSYSGKNCGQNPKFKVPVNKQQLRKLQKYFLIFIFAIWYHFFTPLGGIGFSQTTSTLQWAKFYSGSDSLMNYATAIDAYNDIYVSGNIRTYATGFDIATIKYNQNGDTVWVRIYNSSGNNDDFAVGIIYLTGSGDVYILGQSGSLFGGYDIVVIKYNSAGVLQWTHTYSGAVNANERPSAITSDANGNVFIAGYVTGAGNKGIGAASDYLTFALDTQGNKIWEARYDNNGLADAATGIKTDNNGNVIVTGTSANSSGYSDFLTVKYDGSGNQLWTARYDGSAHLSDLAGAITVDAVGNIFIAGTINYDDKTSPSAHIAESDYGVAAYTPSGALLWEFTYDSDTLALEEASAIEVNSAGNIFVSGKVFHGTTNVSEYHTLSISSSGSLLWAQVEQASTKFMRGFLPKTTLDNEGNIYVTGMKYNGTDGDALLIRYNPDGSLAWRQMYDGGGTDDAALDLAVDAQKNVYITGYTTDSAGMYQFLTVKWGQAGIFPVCGSNLILADALEKDSSIEQIILQNNQIIKKFIHDSLSRLTGNSHGPGFTIPVVVHIISNTTFYPLSNISDAQIDAQIDALNRAFSDNNGSTNNFAHDPEIVFCLAQNFPNLSTDWTIVNSTGKAGVTRLNTTDLSLTVINMNTYSVNAQLANLGFPAERYLNIFVVCNISPSGVVGYAPQGLNTSFPMDGLVIRYDVFGDNTICPSPTCNLLLTNYDKGATAVHEAAHYLSVYHTFQRGPTNGDITCTNDNCEDEGDLCCDTPPVYNPNNIQPDGTGPNFDCISINTCTTDVNSSGSSTVCTSPVSDIDDMVENYMDYTNDNCKNTFSCDQTDRMIYTLSTVRSELVSVDNLGMTGLTSPSGCLPPALICGFVISDNSPCWGTAVTFTTVSTGNTATNWNWDFGDGTILTGSGPHQHAYSSPGVYTVTLNVSDGTNNKSCSQEITVGPWADFFYGSLMVCSGSIIDIGITFTGTPPFQGMVTDGAVTYSFNATTNETVINVTVNSANPEFTLVNFNDAVCGSATGPTLTFIPVECCGNNLISNGDFENYMTGNPDFTTNYQESIAPGQGNYNIDDDAGSVNSGAWSGMDHTPTGQNFMIVDLQMPLTKKIWEKTITVNPCTDYIFSFYLNNVDLSDPGSPSPSNDADLVLNINNTGVLITDRIPNDPDMWVHYSTLWNSGSNISATFTVYANTQPVLGGFDIGIDDISLFVACNSLQVTFASTDVNCTPGNDGTIIATVQGGMPPIQFLWDDKQQQTSQIAVGLTVGTYSVTVTDVNGCSNSASATIAENVTFTDVNGIIIPSSPSSQGITGVNRIVKGGIFIPSGVTLTITNSTFQFSEIGYNHPVYGEWGIVVDVGAKLVLNNCTLTSVAACPTMWDGIFVAGVGEFYPQPPITHNGWVIFSAGGNNLLENAHTGVQSGLWFPPSWPDPTCGGVIQVNSGNKFINNNRHIVVIRYPSRNYPNLRFDNSEFICDDPLPDVFKYNGKGTSEFLIFGSNSSRIKVRGCTFRNRGNFPIVERGTGILNYFSDLVVDGNCFDCYGPNNFINLTKGIHDVEPDLYELTVNGNQFHNNLYGILMDGSMLSTITDNYFTISREGETIGTPPNPVIVVSYQHFGIYCAAATGFRIEGNTFNHYAGANAYGLNYGILAHNSWQYGGKIYRNNFDALNVGNQMQYNNSLALSVDCNTYANEQYDWAVTSGTITSPQGNCNVPPLTNPEANKFSNLTCGMFSRHIHKNTIATPFTYNSYLSIGYFPTCISSGVTANGCISAGPIVDISDVCPPTVTDCNPCEMVTISGASTQIAILNSKIDGGSTQARLQTIVTKPAGQIKDELLLYSPYLSDTVMLAYLAKPKTGKGNVPPGHVKEVIIANSPVTAKVMAAVNNRNLPNGTKQQINSAQTGISARQLLEEQIASLESEKQLTVNQLLTNYIDSGLLDSAILFLETQNTMSAKMAIVPLTLKRDSAKAAKSIEVIRLVADSIESIKPADEQVVNLRTFADFYELLLELYSRSAGIFSLTSTEEQEIRTIATGNTPVAINAQSILRIVFDDDFERLAESIDNPPVAKTGNVGLGENLYVTEMSEDKIIQHNEWYINVIPNPASETFTVSYKLPGNINNSCFTMYDILGNEVIKYPLPKIEGMEKIKINDLREGLYYYSITRDTYSLTRNKLVVIR